jgi:hypothetical protein
MSVHLNSSPVSSPYSPYANPAETASKTEDPHDLMRDIMGAGVNVNRSQLSEMGFSIEEMPEQIETLLNSAKDGQEKALLDYMNDNGMNSLTFINLDDNGNVASIVTVTRNSNNKLALDFKHSERTTGEQISAPYHGHLNKAADLDKFYEFTHPVKSAASNHSASEPDQPVATRIPSFSGAEHNIRELETKTGLTLFNLKDLARVQDADVNRKKAVNRPHRNDAIPLDRPHVRRPKANGKENTPPETSKTADSKRGYANINLGANLNCGTVRVGGNPKVNITVGENSNVKLELPPDAKVTTAQTKKKVSFADPISQEIQEKPLRTNNKTRNKIPPTRISRHTQTPINDANTKNTANTMNITQIGVIGTASPGDNITQHIGVNPSENISIFQANVIGNKTGRNDIENNFGDNVKQTATFKPKPQPQFRENNETIITGKERYGLLSTENHTTFNRCKIYDNRKRFGDNTVLNSEKANFTIADKSEINGKIRSEHANVTVEGESRVNGNIISNSGHITCKDNSRVKGKIKVLSGSVTVDKSKVDSIINHYGPVSLNDARVEGDVKLDNKKFSMASSTIGGTLSLYAKNFTLDDKCSINTLEMKTTPNEYRNPMTHIVTLKAGSTLHNLISEAESGILIVEKGANYKGGDIPNFTIYRE